MSNQAWQFWIDVGGTFCDTMALDPLLKVHRAKILSSAEIRISIGKVYHKEFELHCNYTTNKGFYEGFHYDFQNQNMVKGLLNYNSESDLYSLANNEHIQEGDSIVLFSGEEAPVLSVRLITGTKLSADFPNVHLHLATTRGTNALLEKKGSRIAFLVSEGFRDLQKIGNQQRPDLFQLNIPDKPILYERVYEVKERMSAVGKVIESPGESEILGIVEKLKSAGINQVAIALLNAYQNNEHEILIRRILQKSGIDGVSISSEMFSGIGYLKRSHTTCINAYLTEQIEHYFERIKKELKPNLFKVIRSDASLVQLNSYHAKDSLFSGPAAGVIGAQKVCQSLGYNKALTFDMGGTSTDTSRIENGIEIVPDSQIGPFKVVLPKVDVETVAAGGGSICYYTNGQLQVGPESASAFPGPACYGAGGPLTISDVNLLLGRMDPSRFQIPIDISASFLAINNLRDEIEELSGEKLDLFSLAEGLLNIANEKMAGTIMKVSFDKGIMPKNYPLLGFGGIGGVHACDIAALVDIDQVIVPFDAGILSAYGNGFVPVSKTAYLEVLKPLSEISQSLDALIQDFIKQTAKELKTEEQIEEIENASVNVFCRVLGQASSIQITYSEVDQIPSQFESEYRKVFAYFPSNPQIEIERIRVSISEKSEVASVLNNDHLEGTLTKTKLEVPLDKSKNYQVYSWDTASGLKNIKGPFLINHAFASVFVPEGWSLSVEENLDLLIKKGEQDRKTRIEESELVNLSLFTNRYTAIAEQMGAQLMRTASSVNIRQRLDFSCAIISPFGNLLVNAPHIPVHLGSLGICLRLVLEKIKIKPGDVVICNHPKYGGSHLPDITLIKGVFTDNNQLIAYVANRAHHAELGGKSPGSMPPDAINLEEEGVCFLPQYVIEKGESKLEDIKKQLEQSKFPSRAVNENLADINAAISSLSFGEKRLLEMEREFGLDMMIKQMHLLLENAQNILAQSLAPFRGQELTSAECMDDGTAIKVSVKIDEKQVVFDFSGCGGVHSGNLNANISIVHSVIMYVLRLICGRNIPLNEGLMEKVKVHIPESFLNPHFDDNPVNCPAVVGGNTETSQRVVDTLLQAFGLAACSQGTMNNFLFGNDDFGYYETIGGGTGAGPGFSGQDGVHQHMTNTRITDPEELEYYYPVRLKRFQLRTGSGGPGKYEGGNGVHRELEFLRDLSCTILSQHRKQKPYGMDGGGEGNPGEQYIMRVDGTKESIKGIAQFKVSKGDRFVILTPGGGGWGAE